MKYFKAFLISSVAVGSMWCAPALAQQAASGGAQPAQPDESSLGEIIVTAQRRQQTLQDVPVSVSVVGSDSLSQQHITDTKDLGLVVPSLAVTSSPFQPLVSIRGLGSGAGTRAFEQSVATYVDGIYAGRASQFLNPFFDVERVEVVRGPQGVLFGINAIAGAINVVNKKPGDKLEGHVAAGYEFENSGYNIEGGVSIPLSPTFGVRLSGRADRQGPYLHNTFNNNDEPDTRSQIGRVVASWRPSSDFRADLEYEHAHKSIDGSAFQTAYIPIPGFFPVNIEDGNLDFRKSNTGSPDFTRLTTDNVSLNLGYDLGQHKLTSSTGYSHYNFSQALPAGAVPVYFGTALAEEKFEQFYQELRLEGPSGGTFEYLVGATYYHQDSKINSGTDFDFTAFGAPGITPAIRYGLHQKTDAFAIFGQATLNFTSQFNAVGGLRFSSVHKKANFVLSPSVPGAPLSGYPFDAFSLFVLNAPPISAFQYLNPADPNTIRASIIDRARTYEAVNPSISFNYKFNSDVSVYASYTTGTKAGGFNDQEQSGVVPENGFARDSFEYESEKARNFEIGAKFGFDKVRFNFAAFLAKYKNLQASQALASGAILTTNAASATAKGFEADATVIVAPGLTLSGDLSYIHARYDDYPGSGCIVTINPSTCVPALQNAKGGRLDGVPEFTGSANIAYVVPISDGLELRTRARAYYNDGAQYQSNQDPLDRTPHYWLLDASIGLGQIDKGWSLTLTGKNLANKAIRGFSAPAATPFFGHQSFTLPGRTVYLDLRLDF